MDFLDIKRKYNFLLDKELGVGNRGLLEVPDKIYHYTTFEGAKGILNSRLFWMTDANCLNDTSEIQLGKNTLREIIINSVLPKQESDFFYEFWKIIADHLRNIDNQHSFYVCSFSTMADNYLNWTEHADQQKGFNIGISKRYITRLLNTSKMSLVFGKIRYSEEEFTEIIEKFVKVTNDFLKSYFGKLSKESQAKKLSLEVSIALSIKLLAEICCIKSDYWKDQREYRMIAVFSDIKKPNSIHYMQKVDSRKAYIHSPEFDNNELIEIWSGGLASEEHKQELSHYGVPLIPSRATLRRSA